jgi:uncharacterized membrane protein (TIGR02234 family)
VIRRGRSLAVAVIALCGALGVISSTQTWMHVALVDGASEDLAVPGASAVAVLAPLSLAAIALGLALSIAGTVLRYVFGVLAVVIAVALGAFTAWVLFAQPTSAIAATVTAATGIAGETALSALVESITVTAWPAITLVVCVVLLAAGLFALLTAHTWPRSGRRYRTEDDAGPAAASAGSRPHDAIDSWDDLSRGEDPTTRPVD